MRRFYRLKLFRVGGVSLWSLGGVFRGFILVIVSIRPAFGVVVVGGQAFGLVFIYYTDENMRAWVCNYKYFGFRLFCLCE